MTNGINVLGLDEYHQLVKDGVIDTVICALPDMHGRLLGKRLSAKAFDSKCLNGEGVLASTALFATDIEMNVIELEIANWGNHYRDFRMVPDLSTLRQVPWEPNAAMVLCDAYYAHNEELIEVAPRTILRRQVERAKQQDIAFKFASELEFYLAAVDPVEARAAGYQDLQMTSTFRADFHILQGSRYEWFIHQIRTKMPEFGISIESSKPEYGLGQHEITLDYTDTLTMADQHILFKHGIKELAQKNKLTATFMARPTLDIGSSCHLHFSLWSDTDGSALDWAGDDMSDLFGSFISGQLANSLDLGLMYAPTINSYKRYVPDLLAGTSIAVGVDNRTCAFRIVGHGASYRLENRIPGADTNPYLAYAGTIVAGLDGIDKAMPKPPMFTGYAYSDATLPVMPSNMQESVARFAESKLALDALGEMAHRHLVGFYRNEVRAFNSEPVTDWERNRYYERI